MSKLIDRTGEEKLMNNGQRAWIIAYRNNKDIDIEFEDGVILKYKTYKDFLKGGLRNQTYNLYAIRIGEERVMKNGQKAKIIVYRNYNDVTVRFEDNNIVEHISYGNFKKREVKNPNYNLYSKLGEERVMKNGQKAKIVVYRSTRDIDIEFEDGTVIEHTWYFNFKKGNIANPNLERENKLGTFRIIKKILTKRDEETKEIKFVIWQCKCERCGYENLITPQMMLKHKC